MILFAFTIPITVDNSGTDLRNSRRCGLILFAAGGGGGGETNTGSNQGVDGVGVFDVKSGVDLQFRNVAPASNKVSVVLNSKDIDIASIHFIEVTLFCEYHYNFI